MTLRSRGGTLSLPFTCVEGFGVKTRGASPAFSFCLPALLALASSATARASSLRAQLSPCSSACSLIIRYGLTWASTLPGASTLVESISNQPSGVSRRKKAVPRISVICWTGSFAASRCAISTTARSALPYKSKSHLLSITTERRTLSDQ